MQLRNISETALLQIAKTMLAELEAYKNTNNVSSALYSGIDAFR